MSTVPAAWAGRETSAIAAGLADALIGAMDLGFAFVRLCDPGGGAAVDATRGDAWKRFPEWLQRRLGDAGSLAGVEIVTDAGGSERPLRGIVVPIGIDGEAGLVAAACDRAEFPDETDQLVLSVAGNQAATAFGTARRIDAHRRTTAALSLARTELETRVATRTTELSRTAAEAVAAQRRFRDLVNSVDGIVWEADADSFAFSFVSDQAQRMLGYPAAQWVRDPTFWRDHLHGDDRDRTVQSRVDATADRRSHDVEYRMIAADGRVVWLRDLVTVVVEGDRPICLRGVMVDITERKRAEEEERERRWVLDSMEHVNLAIQVTNDLEQMLCEVLDCALSIFECDRAWLVYPCDPDAVSHGVTMQRTRAEYPGLFEIGEDVPMDPDTAHVFRTVRAASGAVQFGPHAEHPLPSALAKRLGIQSRIVMALYPKGSRPYLFGLSQCSYARTWTPREEFLFQKIGRRLEDALTSLLILRTLRESEKRYRHIFESTGVSIWEEDFSRVKTAIDDLRSRGVRDFRAYFGMHPEVVREAIGMVRIIDVNPTSVKLFGAQSKAELLTSLHTFFVAETYDVFLEELVAIAEERPTVEAETVVQTLQGEKLTVLFTITFPTSSARFDSVLVTIMDITERKQAEYLTRQVFEASPDAVAIIGRDYRYQRVNPGYERTWRLPTDAIVGMHVANLRGVDAFEYALKANLDRCFAGDQVTYGEWLTTAAGRVYHVRTYTPLRGASNEVTAALVINRDMTEHMLAVEALQKAQAELTHVTRVTTLGELAASIAHEVNQPLAAIVADANASLNWLAAERPNVEGVVEALEAIVADGHRAAEVIQRIRQLATKSAPRKALVRLDDVVRDVVPLVRAELHRHEVALVLDVDSVLPPVIGDRVQLQQVVLNLVMNGIEAMVGVDDRPRTLTISARGNGREQVTVGVHDTGVGIDPHEVDRLFTAFFTTKPSGMGMGLSISRSIIDTHGGRLWAERNEAHGAMFQFSLPVARSDGEPEAGRRPPEGRVDSPRRDGTL